MKKTITSTFALATALFSFAAVTSHHDFAKDMTPVSSKFDKVQSVAGKELVHLDDAKSAFKNVAVKAAPEGASEISYYYSAPSGAFYSGTSFSINGQAGYGFPAMLIPAYTDCAFLNGSIYKYTDGKYYLFSETDCEWSWQYVKGDYSDVATATGYDLIENYEAYPVKNNLFNPPVLYADGVEAYAFSGGIMIGGSGQLSESFLVSEGATDIIQGGALPYNAFDDNMVHPGYSLGQFGSNSTASWGEAYADYGYENFKVQGITQIFAKPLAPYALSKINLDVNVTCQAGATLNFSFYKVDESGSMTDVINETSYKFPEAMDNQTVVVPIEFTSGSGLDVYDYKMIDCAMVMVVSGYDSELFTSFDLPVAVMAYPSVATLVDPVAVGALVSLDYNGQAASGILECPYVWTFNMYDGSQVKAIPTSMSFTLDVEYPYLQAFMDFNENTTLTPQESYNVYLEATGSAFYALNCSGDALSIEVPFDVPEWLEYDIQDKVEDAGDGVTMLEYVEIGFAINAEAGKVGDSYDFVLSYKGCTQTFHVTYAAAGVESIAKDNVEVVAVEYYNIQGQKLNAAPENGIFIQKNIKADGSISNVKVVK